MIEGQFGQQQPEFCVCINLTRLVEAARGSGGAGWFGVEICKRLATRARVTVLADPNNADYVRLMLAGQLADNSVVLEVVEEKLGDWLAGPKGEQLEAYVDPLNGLEPHVIPPHIASITVIHDLMFMRDPYVFTDNEIAFRCGHYGDAMRRADLVMTVARREAEDIAALLPDKPVRVVDQPAYFRGNATPERPEGRAPLLFSPGVQWNHKNHFRLVSAFLQLMEEGRIDAASRLCLSAVLPIEANHQLLKPLLRQSAHGDAVIQLPYLSRSRFATFLERCDGIVLPSVHEGYGIPLVEAVVAGKPILTTRVPSVDALAEVPESVRFIENPKDIHSIAKALEAFVLDMPSARPRPDLCPSADSFTEQLVAAIGDAIKERRSRSSTTSPPRFFIKRRAETCLSLVVSDGSEMAGTDWGRLGQGQAKLFGVPDAPPSGAIVACASTDPGFQALSMAHEILLSESRFILICSTMQFQRLNADNVLSAIERLRHARGKAKVRLVDLGLGEASTGLDPRALAPGLYDLKDLDLPFEASLEEILSRMEQAAALYRPTTPRALIIDPSLKNPNGHHLAVATTLAKSLEINGYYTTVACNFEMSFHSVEGANETIPLLSDYLYEQRGDIGLAQAQFANAFASAGVGSGDLVYAFCATPTMLAAFALHLAQLPKSTRPHIVIRFDRPEWRTPQTSVGYEDAFRLIRSFGLREYFSFSVESRGLQRYFELCSGEELPIIFNYVSPIDTDLTAIIGDSEARSSGIVVSYVGEAREEKGFQHLPGVLRNVLSEIGEADVQFRIQCGANTWNQTPAILNAKRKLVELAHADPRIKLLDGALPEDEYLDLIRKADIVFLPYFPPQYRIRGSGIATEAAAFGTAMVISHGLDIAETYSTAHVTESRDYSVAALAAALLSRIKTTASLSTEERHARRKTGSGNLAQFALSFIQSPGQIAASSSRIALWIANDTQGEGSEIVYSSQIDFLRAKGYFVIKLVAPYPARWRLEHPWLFDATAFASSGEVVLNFQPGPNIEHVMEKLAHGGNVLANFLAAWDLTTAPTLVENLIKYSPPSLAVVNYAHHGKIIRALAGDNVPSIVETHDIQALQYAIQQNRAVDPQQLAAEIKLVESFDHIVSISRSEAEVFAEHCGIDKVTWCMPFADVERIPLSETWDHDLLFVGSAHHANVESLRWFLSEVYGPMLHPQGLSLAIVGNAGQAVDVESFGSLVTCPGRVPNLAEWYAKCGIAVLPVISGAGVPIKVIDAMTRGVPFVLTDFPNKAMSLDATIPLAASSLQFAEQILACLASPEERARRAAAGYKFAQSALTRESYYATWNHVLAKVLAKAPS